MARYLAPLYGHAPERVAAARERVRWILSLLDAELERSRAAGHAYLVGDTVTALDVYLATFLTLLVGLDDGDCPALRPELRDAFRCLREVPEAQVSPALRAHRERIYQRHLAWPIAL